MSIARVVLRRLRSVASLCKLEAQTKTDDANSRPNETTTLVNILYRIGIASTRPSYSPTSSFDARSFRRSKHQLSARINKVSIPVQSGDNRITIHISISARIGSLCLKIRADKKVHESTFTCRRKVAALSSAGEATYPNVAKCPDAAERNSR